MDTKFINLIGPGSMGHLWAAYLIEAQLNVEIYTKQKVASQKLELRAPNHSFLFNASYKTQEQWRIADFIIICVKATALKTVCQQLRTFSISHPPILLMMNGLGLVEIVEHYLPKTLVYHATTTHGARYEKRTEAEKATLFHTGCGETLIGETRFIEGNDSNNQPIFAIIDQLNRALPITRWDTHHSNSLWTKLLINSIINPLTAIHNVNNGAIVSDPQLRHLARNLTQQLSPIIDKYLPGETWQSIFEKVETVANQTYTNISSMRQDLLAGRRTEIDFISGYILKKAESHNIALPDHVQIVDQVKALEYEYHNAVTN